MLQPLMPKMKLDDSMNTYKASRTNTKKWCPFHFRWLECKSRKSRDMNKSTNEASGGDGIPAELFQILKYDTVKVYSVYQQIWKTQWPQDWKRSVFIPVPENGNAKECSNYCTIVLISHASKVMFKILQARLKQYVNWELPMYKSDLEKAEELEINCQHSLDHRKS